MKRLFVVVLLSSLAACSTFRGTTSNTAALSHDARVALQNLNLGANAVLTREGVRSAAAAAPPAAAAAIAAAPDNLDDAYSKMMDYCHATLTRFEKRASSMGYWSAAIAVVGSLAGGVAVPALSAASASNKAWTAALGGVSGAANAGQSSLNSAGLTAASELQSRQDVLTSWKADIAPYYDSTKTLAEQQKAVAKAYADCELYEISTPSPSGSK